MKIEKKYIIEICNLSHPQFGTFASFLDGLGKGSSIEVPQPPDPIYLCHECARPLWGGTKICLYCLGVRDANEKVNKNKEEPAQDILENAKPQQEEKE